MNNFHYKVTYSDSLFHQDNPATAFVIRDVMSKRCLGTTYEYSSVTMDVDQTNDK